MDQGHKLETGSHGATAAEGMCVCVGGGGLNGEMNISKHCSCDRGKENKLQSMSRLAI